MVFYKKLGCAALALMLFSCTSKSSKPKATHISNDTQKVKRVIKQKTVGTRSDTAFAVIEGTYIQKPMEEGEADCKLSVRIERKHNGFYYTFSMQDSIVKGKVTVSKSDHSTEFKYMVTLEGIKWASYEGNISDESKTQLPLKIPEGIETGFANNELVFQNYGNSMNSYTVLEGCDQKYIRLVKQ